MKKRTKVFLIVISSIVVVFGCFIGGLALFGTCFDKYDEKGDTYKDWMKDIKDDTKLEDISIPGTHDSGTYGMNWLSCTQTYSVKEQLYSGARYLDLRVNKSGEDKYVMFHSVMNGTEFEPILKDIKDFIVSYPTETLLLDFQHFKGGSDEKVKDLICSYLKDNNLLVVNSTAESDLEFVSSLTLKDVRGKCLAFFGDSSSFTSENYIFKRNDDSCSLKGTALNSCYVSSYNKSNSSTYIKEGLPYYIQNIKDKITNEKYKGIFVLQGQLTDGSLIFGPYSKEKKHSENMSNYIKGLTDSADLDLINVIMRDFITPSKCKEIIDLNEAKGNLKTA